MPKSRAPPPRRLIHPTDPDLHSATTAGTRDVPDDGREHAVTPGGASPSGTIRRLLRKAAEKQKTSRLGPPSGARMRERAISL